jgi:light-regulated signal transduction histidine kinase (bacteriophytochrome)
MTGPPSFCPHSLSLIDGKEHVAEVHEDRLGGDFLVTTTPLLDEEGKMLGTVHVSRDITERKRDEEKIRKLNDKLKNSITQLAAANRELEAFSSSVSHDLRAPLRSIAGFSQVLQEDYAERLDEEGRDALQRIVAGTHRMGRLIDDLLDLSRVTRTEMRRERVNLSGMAQRIAASLAQSQPERQVQWLIAADVFVDGDEHLLLVLLDNLLRNAFKFTAKQPAATIEFGAMEQPDGEKVYFVKDNGAGFDMSYAGKLFSPFQRLHTTSEFPGTGIGLATVKRIINRHGGRVWIEGEPGKGTVVFFAL